MNALKEVSMSYGECPIIICSNSENEKRFLAEYQNEYGVRILNLEAKDYATESAYVDAILDACKSLCEEADLFAYEYVLISNDERIIDLLKSNICIRSCRLMPIEGESITTHLNKLQEEIISYFEKENMLHLCERFREWNEKITMEE